MGLFDFILGTREDRFAKRVIERLRQRGWDGPLVYARERFAIETGNTTHNLARMFEDWLNYPRSERASALDEALNSFFEPPVTGPYDEVAHLLLPLVRGLHELGVSVADENDRPADLPLRPLSGPLGVTVVFDQPSSVQFITAGQLERLGRSFEDLLERALTNQRAKPPCDFELQADGYYVGDYGEVYASSRLLQPEIFQALPLKGAPVVMVPARGVLLVAGAEDARALEQMAIFGVHVARTDNRPIAFTPLVLQDGVWAPFASGPDAPLALRRLHVSQELWDYAEQHRRLTADLETRGEDLFVAKFDASELKGQILSCATWTDDVPTLLPKADTLILHDADWNSICRRWEDVEAVCGAFLQEPGLDPPRYRTGPPPDAEGWRRLREDYGSPNGWPELR